MESASKYLAHLIISEKRQEQTLKEHCCHVADYASEVLESCGLSACGRLAGLLHDMGKGRSGFQKYLEKAAYWDAYRNGFANEPEFAEPRRGSEIHTFQGCIYILERYHRENEPLGKLTAEILACAIGSHHGLFDCQGLDGKNGFSYRSKYNREKLQYEETKAYLENCLIEPKDLDSLFKRAKEEVQAFLDRLAGEISKLKIDENRILNYSCFEISMAVRMITSALMYADRRDTAEFYNVTSYADIAPNWAEDIQEFEKKYSCFEQTKAIDVVRKNISDQCVSFAEEPSGIYRLEVPTGGGKTLSALRYALYHAQKYKKKRILFVAPLLTIIDQNAAVWKEYLPKESVLEHHSDVITEDMSETELSKFDVMRDRWSAPVIITTMVRILNILFGAQTGDLARMRALCDAVIIFDEVQTVPNKTVSLFTGALNFLADFCRSDIILCSATQPAFERTIYPIHVSDKQPVKLNDDQMKAFERHRYHLLADGKSVTLDEISEMALQIARPDKPLMIVCNTKSEAKKLYVLLKENSSPLTDIRHLSAGMCKAHRKKVIEEINDILKEIQSGENHSTFILVATQLVEAGVDVSFQSVIRLEAGDDNLVQSAGRCNRSDEYGRGDAYMARVRDENNSLRNLPDILAAKTSMDDTLGLYGKNWDFSPANDRFIEHFYEILYRRLGREGQTLFPFQYDGETYCIGNILGNDLSPSENSEEYLMSQPFLTAGREYKVFDDNTYSVLVPYGEGAEIIEEIQNVCEYNDMIPAELLRQAGDYSVQIYEWQKRKMEEEGALYNLCSEGARSIGDGSSEKIYAVYPAAYSEVYGIDVEAQYKSSDMIF